MTHHAHGHYRNHDHGTSLRRIGIDSSLTLSLTQDGQDLLSAPGGGTPAYTLLVKGGRVIDPGQGISDERDVAISGSKIARVAKDIPGPEAQPVLDARGKIVTPGLIDLHVHVY